MKLATSILSLTVGLLGVAKPAAASIETCSFARLGTDNKPVYEVQKVEYFHAPANYNYNAWRCDWNTGRCSLSGWVISKRDIPASGHQPAIIFEHGSEGGVDNYTTPVEDDHSLTSYSCPIKAFVDAGYVVFMPYRRGTVDNTDPSTLPFAARGLEGWSNSGWAANEYAINQLESNGYALDNDNYTIEYIRYLQAEVDDLISGMTTLDNYVRPDMTSKLVDSTRVAVVGHSIGGAFSTFAGTDDDLFDTSLVPHGPRMFVSLSGAAMSYHGSHWWHDVLTSSAAINNAPLYFTRALDEDARTPNDFASSSEPYAALGFYPLKSGKAQFSAVNATCPASVDPWQCQHSAFVTNADQIARWFPYVNAALHNAGM